MALGMKVGLGPVHIVLDGETAPLPQKRGQSPPPIFGPSLLWPNGWMHQGATWYGGRPQPRRLCWMGTQPLPRKGRSHTQFSAHVYCGQMAGWMKTPLGTGVDLGPGHIVLDGGPSSRERGTAAPPPILRPCLLWPRSPISATAELLSGRGLLFHFVSFVTDILPADSLYI